MTKKISYKRLTKNHLAYLKEQGAKGYINAFLANGILRSSKDISYNPDTKKFFMLHCIDGTDEVLSEKAMQEYLTTHNLFIEIE